MTRAAIYLRQSLDERGEGEAVGRQKDACERMCADREWEIAKVYQDNDISAYDKKKIRPEFEKMKLDAAEGKFDAIVVFQLDRLLRRVRDLEPLLTLAIPIVSFSGLLDLSTPGGVMVARMLVVVAENEVAQKSFRQLVANEDRASKGRPRIWLPPFGYSYEIDTTDPTRKRKIMVVDQDAKPLIVAAYDKVIATKGALSLRGLAAEWNEAGHRTTRGHEWVSRTVRMCLLNPRNAGILMRHGSEVAAGTWEPLVDYDKFARVRKILSNEARRTNKQGNGRKYMMSGLARCGFPGCSGLMGTGRTERNLRTYVCHRKHLSRSAEPIDEFVREVVVQRLRRSDAADLLVETPSDDTTDIHDKIKKLQARLDALPAQFALLDVNPAAVTAAGETITRQIAEWESKIEYSSRAPALRPLAEAADPAEVWDQLDVHERRAVVDALMTVTLLPAGRGSRTFRPETVSIKFK